MHRLRVSLVLLASTLLLSACMGDNGDRDDAPIVPDVAFDTARMRLVTQSDTLHLTVELAQTDQQKTLGLMERRSLADSAGMLFVYPASQPESATFWMYRTRIPLDIAYLDSTGTIRAVVAMEPCPATLIQGCPGYPAGVPYRAALEVNRGMFQRRGVTIGDRLLLSDTAAHAAPSP